MASRVGRDEPSSPPERQTFTLQRQTMAGQVAEELRRRILAGELPEGTQLLQEQFAAEFGVSKVPIREALHILEAEGLVMQQFHRGAVVAGLSPDEIMEVFQLRTEIEVWLLDLGMQAATQEDVDKAQSFNDMLRDEAEPDRAWDMNWRFHEALYTPAHKPFVIEELKKLHDQVARYVRRQYAIALNQGVIVEEHNLLLQLYAQKSKKAKDRLGKHILGSAGRLTEHLARLNEAARVQEPAVRRSSPPLP